MSWRNLIDTAYLLAGRTNPAAGRPRQAMLQRAVSTAYYAMFHALCFSNANTIVGSSPVADREAWTRTYRAVEHGQAHRQMAPNSLTNSPPEIRNFAKTFRSLQRERHRADYDPNARFIRYDVLRLIE